MAAKKLVMLHRAAVLFALAQLVLSCGFCAALDASDEEEGVDSWSSSFWEVAELTDETFDAWIGEHPRALVDFYASWCGHCQQLTPEMDRAAPLLVASSPPIAVAKIDTDKNKKVGKHYGISQFPTLKIFENGEPIHEYEGDRSAEAMAGTTKRLFLPNLTILDPSPTSLQTFIQETVTEGDPSPLFVVMGTPREEALDAILAIAGKEKKSAYFVQHPSPSLEMLANFGIEEGPAFAAFRPKHGEREVFSGAFDVASLDMFVRNNLLPLLTPLDGQSHHAIVTNGRQVALAILNGSDTSESSDFVSLSRKLAESHRNFTFASVDANVFAGFSKQFQPKGVAAWLPTLVVWDMDTAFYSPESTEGLRGSGVLSALDDFLTDVEKGRVPVKSTRGPTPWEHFREQFMLVVNSSHFPFYIVCLATISLTVLLRRFPNQPSPNKSTTGNLDLDDKPKEGIAEALAEDNNNSKAKKGKGKGKSRTDSADGEQQADEKVYVEKKDN